MSYNTEQIVTATYTGTSRFRIPMGLDIQKLIQEKKAFILWDKLYICLNDDEDDEKRWKEIEPHWKAEDDIDWKRGGKIDVWKFNPSQDTKEEGDSDSEEEEEEDDEEVSDDMKVN